MRRRWNRMLLAALVASITFFYPLLAPTPHRIDQAHADLIVRGMTKEQVEAIFGVPDGSYDWAEADGRARHPVHLALFDVLARERFVTQIQAASMADGNDQMVLEELRVSPIYIQTSLTWTSRHGAFIIWFDDRERVVSVNSSTEVRIVPPWQRWWSRYWKK